MTVRFEHAIHDRKEKTINGCAIEEGGKAERFVHESRTCSWHWGNYCLYKQLDGLAWSMTIAEWEFRDLEVHNRA